MSYQMNLNKKYLVTTIGSRKYLNTLVEVVGKVNYEETKKTGFNVDILALNEMIVVENDNYSEYFKDTEFFKCRIIQSNKIICLWSDIIDSTMTTLLEDVFSYKSSLKISLPQNSSDPHFTERDIISALIATASAHGATLTMQVQKGDINTTIDIFDKRLKECENVLRSLQSLSVLTPVLDRLSANDMNLKIDSISSTLDTILENISTISAGLS